MAAPNQALAKAEAFVISADPHVRFQGDDRLIKNNADTMRAFKWARKQDNLKAVVVAGDIADRGYAGDFATYDLLWRKARVDATRIQCMGNHDTNNGGELSGLSIERCTTAFKRINNGKLTSYTQFKTANIMTVGGPYHKGGKGVYTNSMLERLNDRLCETVRQGKMAIVVSHYPYSAQMKNSDKLLAILKSYPNVIFVSGHVHYYPSNKWFEVAKLESDVTPYRRAGIKAQKVSYPIHSVGIDSITRNHSVNGTWKSTGQSTTSLLKISRSGKIAYQRYSLTEKKATNTWKARQLKGSITVKAVSKTPKKKGKITYKVVFSDGRTHDGIESGSTIKVRIGKQKTIDDIPAGVLVTVKCVDAPDGWSKSGKGKIEVIPGNRAIVFKHVYKQPKKPKKTAPAPSSSSSSATTQPENPSTAAATEPEQAVAEATMDDAATPAGETVDDTSTASEENGIEESPVVPDESETPNDQGNTNESASSSPSEGSSDFEGEPDEEVPEQPGNDSSTDHPDENTFGETGEPLESESPEASMPSQA